MHKKNLQDIKLLQQVSLSMIRENILGIFHGSISMKISSDRFLINKKNAIFDEIDDQSLIELSISKHSMWMVGSNQAHIHAAIYDNISSAKYIVFSAASYIIACSLKYKTIIPQDYAGKLLWSKLPVYDMKSPKDWQDRAPTEIVKYMQNNHQNIVVVKGEGVYAYDRDLFRLIKHLSILQKSTHIILLSNLIDPSYPLVL